MSKKSSQGKQNKKGPSEKRSPSKNKSPEKDTPGIPLRPPIVCFLGHVDHGKTTLLDQIRQTTVQEGEAGGITQAVGAYHVEEITFIDTPGHEAFTAMRARGGHTADIAVLVVAADDGVMPQTVEALDHIRAAEVPIIVAINKIDLEEAQPEKVKQQLAEEEILVEDWGGEVVSVECSGITGEGIDELLEMIRLVAELEELHSDPKAETEGVLIESTLDPKRGPLATLIVMQGTLKQRDFIVANKTYGRIKQMWDWQGEIIKEVRPGYPAEVLGLKEPAPAGSKFVVVNDEGEAQEAISQPQKVKSTPQIQETEEGTKTLNFILKANTEGALDAVRESIYQHQAQEETPPNQRVNINIIHQGLGPISEADTLLAQTSQAVILGFQIREDRVAKQIIKQQGLISRTYDIIYHLLEDIDILIQGKKREGELISTGTAQVLKTFTLSDGTVVAGCQVKKGTMVPRKQARVIRDKKVIARGKIDSLRQEKDKATTIPKGEECGIVIDPPVEFQKGDFIQSLEKAQIEALV